MQAVTKALDECIFRIPAEILDTVFIKRDRRWQGIPLSLDEQILNVVVRPRVMVDCNLIGGTEVYINLDGIEYTRTNDYTSVYRIPKSRTQGRTILTALNVTYTDPNRVSSYGNTASIHNSSMLQVASGVMDAMGSIPITNTARVQLIGENVIMIRDTITLPGNIFLRCILANDDQMSHLQLRSFRHFSNLVVLAVKSYIYNKYIVQMDIGELHGGQNLGKFKDIIDSYADAEELYQTYLNEKWEKVSYFQDAETMARHLRLLIGGSR